MTGIKTDTEKLKAAGNALFEECISMKDRLQELKDTLGRIDSCIYCRVILSLKKEAADKIENAIGKLLRMEHHIEKLDAIAGEYENAERRNTDESYSIDRG